GAIVSRQHRVAIPLTWHDTRVGVLTGQARWRVGFLRSDLLRRFGVQTAEMIVNARLNEETRRLSDFKTRMIRMASHDLKNPLTRIMGYAEMLQSRAEAADELTQKSLNHIVLASEEMNGIILDLLDLEQARQGAKTPVEYDLLQVLDDVIMRAESDMQRRGQTFSVEMPDTLPPLTGEAAQMRQAFGNLLGNASKYTPEGGQIALRVWQQAGQVRVEIADNGYGIPASELPHLFEEFYRVKTDQTASISGSGLGLSLVKAVIEAHGGQVWAQSEYGAGSTFTADLPFAHPGQQQGGPETA
ncbi:MAG: HAMP domain-containing histidine kinase, partial [Anaerolineae bacterium]|nr:HAMP domain-containing histidine kinase [Anaerolineae bacterium]